MGPGALNSLYKWNRRFEQELLQDYICSLLIKHFLN